MSVVLAIGDLHCPFTRKGYLRFCKNVDRRFSCNRVVFIGDIIDNHYSSFHDSDPDGRAAGDELEAAIKEVGKWYRAFPEATVCIGNHDRIVNRKAFSSGISKKWIRNYGEVLGTPGWDFVESVEIDDVIYCHGDQKKAAQRSTTNMQSVVQGHYHTDSYVIWKTGSKFRVFGMQVGCGIDKNSYAMAYGKYGPHPSLGCGVIFNGKDAMPVLMDL